MANGKKLVHDTFLYAVANFGSKLLVFLMLPLYTHYFTTSEYGLWDLIVTTTTLLAPFITFELVAAVYRWLINEQDEEEKKSVITTGVITLLRNVIIFNVITVIVLLFVSVPYGWEALVLTNVLIASSFFQQCARGLGFNKLFASLGIIQAAIIVVLNLIFILALDLGLEALFYSSIIAGVCVILIAWKTMQFGNYISVHAYSKDLIKSFLVYSVPIIPGAASWWVMTMSDRYFITIYMGMEENGIYAIANKIPAILLMVNAVFSLAWKDSAILEFKSDDKDAYYSKVFRHFFRLMATSVILLTLLTKPILELVIANDFYSAWKYIGILLLATLFSALSQFWGAGYHGAKKTNIIFVTSLVGAIINVLINLIFISYIGLYAVAISTFSAFLTMWLIRVFSSNQYFKITMNYWDMAVLFVFILLAIAASFTFDTTGIVVSIALGLLLFFIYNFEIIKFLYRTAFKKLRKSN